MTDRPPQGPGHLLVILAPWLILICFVLLLAVPPGNRLAEWLLDEDRPVEMLTFVLLLWAALAAGRLAAQSFRYGEAAWTTAFYALFALLSLVVAMEEIAWGQRFLSVDTPQFMKDINVQDEITLHNLHGHNSAIDLFAWGMAGLLGIVLARFEQLPKITPPPVMLSWFAAITLAGGIDAFTDQSQADRLPIYIIAWMGEVTEMLISMASLLFVMLKRQELSAAWRQAAWVRGRGA